MEYNKTKRKIELIANSLGAVFSAIVLVYFLYSLIFTLCRAIYFNVLSTVLGFSLLIIILGLYLSFSIICLRNPISKDGVLKKRIGFKIYNTVIGIIGLLASLVAVIYTASTLTLLYVKNAFIMSVVGLVCALVYDVLMIVAWRQVNTEEEKAARRAAKEKHINSVNILQPQDTNLDFSQKINELSHYKELGILSEEEYNKKVDEIISNL